ncbi:Armadillo-like helical-containing protein [Dioscorea alata]|uniref:Armadillo-like helical-containing protein n=1 Tax=Dioscorea alata TaxID=55571 RepID=A0ACB7W5T5_DIOAL|nr:Armadillo-like helical-containing protein [Dioscorea alata]
MSSDVRDEDEEMGIAGEIPSCGKGHRSSLVLQTFEGGAICLVCLSALLSEPSSPSHHVSYALSQVSAAFRSPSFLLGFRTVHPHFLVAPLVRALSSFDDEPLARQIIDLITDLCGDGGSGSISSDFISRISDVLSSGSLAWCRRQVHMLHCLGLLLDSHQSSNPTTHIRDKAALCSNLVIGMQLPSEEIRGEILFILYKLSVLEGTPWDSYDSNHVEVSLIETSQLLRLSLEVLLKTQHDEVRLNCIALLTVLAQKGLFEDSCRSDLIHMSFQESDSLTETEKEMLHIPLVNLFADAIKNPLLSSDAQVQISTLDLVFHCLSSNLNSFGQIQTLIEENIADYVFEALRLSGNKDPLVISCLHVLDLLATAEDSFRQRLHVGFPTLLSVLHYVVEIPLHPVQRQAIKLVWICISNCPGMVSISQVEEIIVTLKGFFSRHGRGEVDIPPETFILACLTFVEIIKSPSASQVQKLRPVIQEASKSAVASSVSLPHGSSTPYLLYSLYILKELHMHNHEESSTVDAENEELEKSIIQICETYLLSWLEIYRDEGEEEEVILGVLEIFHLILLEGYEIQAHKFAETLASSYWFTLSFGCLGVFPSDRMKSRIYLMLSSIVDRIFGPDFGVSIILAYIYLPSDPIELLFLLGQDGSHDSTLMCCQRATLLILYVSSLYDDRLADENQVLASLEQYILVNSHNFSCETTDTILLTRLIFLYGLFKSAAGHRTSNSTEAEKLFFNLAVKMEWDLLNIRSHPKALKWLFQQEELIEPLSYQLLNFCRIHSTGKDKVSTYSRNIKTMDLQMVAELVVSGDNCVTSLLVSLLEDVIEEGREDDTISILRVIEAILGIYPDSSNQFSLNGISDAVYYVCHSRHCSHMIFVTCLLLIFNVLYLINSTAISKEGKWPAITIKLLEFLHPKLASQTSGSEEHLVISILCLILQHASSDVLTESSKAIVLCTSLISAVDIVVKTACAKGPALADYNEETATGESLVFVLLLFFYSLKSSHALFHQTIDWQDFLQTSGEVQPLKVMRIQCNDLCRLVHFGSSLVKLVASQCLVELLSRISDQTSKNEGSKCSARYLESMMALTEGLLFYDDSTVAANCGWLWRNYH